MDGPSRNGGCRQSRRSRSQRDRERRRRRDLAERRVSSPSSASDQDVCRGDSLLGAAGGECRPGFPGVRHRPPRRRKRESVSCEEDIIDGFAIASFISLEALEMDSSMKPPERAGGLMGRGSKRKRGPEENGGGPLSEPEEGPPASFTTTSSSWDKYRKGERKRKRKREEKATGNHFVETGYICDTESDSGDKASDNDMEPIFFVKKVDPVPSSMASSVANGCPLVSTHSGVPRLAVTPRVSGLERSQERSLDLPYPEPLSTPTSSSLSCLPSSHSMATATVPSLPEQINGNGHLHHRPQERGGGSPRPKHKFLTFPCRPTSNAYSMGVNGRSSTSVKPPSSATVTSSSMRPPTPSISVPLSHGRGPGATGPHRPPSRPNSRTYSPGLPPPPPLLSGHSGADQDRLRQELNSQYLPSQGPERDGRSSAPGASSSSSSSSSTGPSVSNATSSTATTRPSQSQPSIPPMYQFHQHNHQHQHTHTHQHFLHPTATAAPLYEKYPGPKMESLFRHPVRISHRQYFPQYPPQVPGIQPVLPPTGPFGSLQGAFQPKLVALQGAAPEMTARLGVIPPHLQPKDPRLTDPFAPSLKVSNKPGKWCAMHVRVAWMILRHQEKVKLMQADPHKLDFRNDLLTRLPGPGGMSGLGGLGVLGGTLPPTHDLTRPGGLFAPGGGVNPTSSPFIPPAAPHSSFLTPAAHLDPYGRSPPFTPLGALGSGAFGGLGSPTLGGAVFGHKDSASGPTVGGMGNPHDPWNRLHVAPASFPSGPPWAKAGEKRDERERTKEPERREVTHIKDERDRDNMLYGRPPMRMSPGAPTIKQQHRSSTPISHINGLGASLSSTVGPSEGPSRDRERERDRERDRDIDKRALHSSIAPSRPPMPPSATTSSSAPDRPRSSSSSVLTTPPPPSTSLASSPLDLFPRHAPPQLPHSVVGPEPHHSSQRDSVGPASSSSSSSSSAVASHQIKKTDRTTTPVSKQAPNMPAGILLPPVKVKEERKEEPLPPHGYDRPSSRHPHHPSTPSSGLSLTPTPGMSIPQLSAHPHPSLLDRSRAAALEVYLGGAAAGRFAAHPHMPPQGHAQAPHPFPWDQWRELAAQQQQQQQRRELALQADPHLALRSDPHLSRLLQHQQAQRILEAERAVAVAVAASAANPHHNSRVATPPTSVASTSGRPDFGLIAHPFDRPPPLGGPGGGLLDEEQRSQILREDFERARFSSMHPHPHLSSPHLPSPSHAFHLEQLHAGLLSHPHLHAPGASTSPHLGLYSRLGPLHPQSHIPNGILTKTPAGLVGAPPPLIPSVTSRSSTPPRPSRLGGVAELALFSAHKDAESR